MFLYIKDKFTSKSEENSLISSKKQLRHLFLIMAASLNIVDWKHSDIILQKSILWQGFFSTMQCNQELVEMPHQAKKWGNDH